MSADTQPGGGATESEVKQNPWERLETWLDEDPAAKRHKVAALEIQGVLIVAENKLPQERRVAVGARSQISEMNWEREERERVRQAQRRSQINRASGHYIAAEDHILGMVDELVAFDSAHLDTYDTRRLWRLYPEQRDRALRGTVGSRLYRIADQQIANNPRSLIYQLVR